MKTNFESVEFEITIKNAVLSSRSMCEAASKVGVNFQTFRKYAIKYNVWKTNISGKGIRKSTPKTATSLQEILEGKHKAYPRGKLKARLLKYELKHNVCEICQLTEWNGQKLTMHLDHINGDCWDHRLENLRMLCPNCHSQTHTYCGRNRSNLNDIKTSTA